MISVIKDKQELDEILKNTSKTVIIDFYAEWCGPCKMLAPVLDEIDGERNDVAIYKINVDNSPALAQEFKIQSIPVIIVFKNKEQVKKFVGLQSKDVIISALGRLN